MRVILAEDHVLVRQGIASILTSCGCEVVGEAGTVPETLDLLATVGCDVVVLDIRLPPNETDEGIRAAEIIRARFPTVGLLVLSAYATSAYARDLFRLDGHGVGYYMKQQSNAAQLCEVVHRVARGERALAPEIVHRLIEHPYQHARLGALSPRERQVLALVAQGRTNNAISDTLRMKTKQVEDTVSAIFDKLGLPSDKHHNRRILATLEYLRAYDPD